MWAKTRYGTFLPLLGKGMPGSPKKQMNKEFHELHGGNTQLSGKGKHIQCKQYGHNKKTRRGPVHQFQNVSLSLHLRVC